MTGNNTTPASAAKARAAVWGDAPHIATTLARAFCNDPLICFILADETTRPAKMPQLFGLLFKLGLPYGVCDVTEGYEAVALWRPPGRWHIPFHQIITNVPGILRVYGLSAGLRVRSIMAHIEKHHPTEPHYYLQVIGTDPDKQEKGFGGAVIRRHLAIADAACLPSYLEASHTKNIPLYQHFGFELLGEIEIPGGGPPLYPMWRKPQAGCHVHAA